MKQTNVSGVPGDMSPATRTVSAGHPTRGGSRPTRRRLVAATLGLGVAMAPLVLAPVPAQAASVAYNVVDDTAGHVTADALPTVQIDNGVVWSSTIAGDTVFAGGQFSNARPPGAAAGTNLTPRSNLLAFSLSTGQLNTTFAPRVNGVVKVLALSPDKSVLYLGGTFTQVNGQSRAHIAAVSTTTGALLPFAPNANNEVDAIAVSSSTVYFGGGFTSVNGQSRPFLAAATPAGDLTGWAPAANYVVRGLALTPDGSRVIAGGSFQQINGAMSPSLASLDAITGTLYPFSANQTIQNYGTTSGVWSLKSDGTSILATGYWFSDIGNFEGVTRLDPYTGAIDWMADCHGDSYDTATMNGVVYSVSHHHDCSNVNTQPQQSPTWKHQRADSWTYDATTTVGTNQAGGYHDFSGQPAPSEYAWFPTLAAGTATGQSQAAWTVSASNGYVVLGGEFPSVNDRAQYGLVRFATPDKAPRKQGPNLSPTAMTPTLTAVGNAVKVNWPSSWDRDNQQLTYTLYRDDLGRTPLFSTTTTSQWWNLPTLGYLDTGLATNTSYTYHVVVTDTDGNNVVSRSATVTTATSSIDDSPYAQAVASDGASHYWRLTEPAGSTNVIDWIGKDDMTVGSGVTLGANGFMSASNDTAASFDGTDNGRAVATQNETASNTLSIETWIRTSTTQGGKIFGFGGSGTLANSNSYDRHIYMDNAGHLVWGTNGGWPHTLVSSASYNDDQWHQVVATLSNTGTTLWVDGIQVGADATETTGENSTGHWHMGGDSLSGWANAPTSTDFQGLVDDTSVYPTALTRTQIRNHYALSGRTVSLPQRPSDSYGGLVYDDNPELYWRLDETSGTTAHDATQNLTNGTYTGGYTQGQTPAVEGSAVQFNGQDAGVHENDSEKSPDTYSEEAWFNTTSTAGGKIIGFGNAATGTSGNYDRHVYMDPSGHLNFGVWTGQANVLTTNSPYNDGSWHHVVATQGSDGMHLYVDGVLQGSNTVTNPTDYQGYWRVGGDSNWNGANYFNGEIDEAAVYDKVLTRDQVRAHYRAAATSRNQAPTASFTTNCDTAGACVATAQAADIDGTVASYAWSVDGAIQDSDQPELSTRLSNGTHTITLLVTDDQGATVTVSHDVTVTVVNHPPVAGFSSSCDNASCSFDAALSSDVDGTVASYAWDFGDGSTGTGATPTHVYKKAGDYTVTLTVTDDQGAQGTGSKTVSVTVPAPPTASFTTTTSGLTTKVDASGSIDTDGKINSYDWDFGDGGQGTGAHASHTYAAAGTYTVTLTVTDDQGLADITTHAVTVTPLILASDTYQRTGSSWGTATIGGTYTYSGAGSFSTNGSAGLISLTRPSSGPTAQMGVSATDFTWTGGLSLNKFDNGTGVYTSVVLRHTATSDYKVKVRVQRTGAATLSITKMTNGVESTLAITPLATYTAGTTLNLSITIRGTSQVAIQASAWVGATAPSTPTLSTVDTANPLASGSLGFMGYLSSASTNTPITVAIRPWTMTTA